MVRFAFAAIGSTIFGALGATAGSVLPFAGNIIGGLLGGIAGDFAGKWLYDTFFSGKKPVINESDKIDSVDDLKEDEIRRQRETHVQDNDQRVPHIQQSLLEEAEINLLWQET